jgi:DNA-binding NtrC family response regulator
LKTWLQRLGFKVWLASGGLKGVVLYRQHQDAIAVALLDVNMPGLDGPDTLTALQEINPRLRACFMSGWVGKHTAEDLFRRGALCILDKPLRLDEVSRLLRRMTESGAAAWSDREGLGVARESSMQPPAAAATADPLAGS